MACGPDVNKNDVAGRSTRNDAVAARGERVSDEDFEGLRSVSPALLAGFDLDTPLEELDEHALIKILTIPVLLRTEGELLLQRL